MLFIIGSIPRNSIRCLGHAAPRGPIPGAKLVVADPRKIDITEFATLHIRQRPGTDIPLINGLMYIILEKGWEDKLSSRNARKTSTSSKPL